MLGVVGFASVCVALLATATTIPDQFSF